jgi:hypothetical protein
MEVIKDTKDFFKKLNIKIVEDKITILYIKEGVLYISSSSTDADREELIKHWPAFQKEAKSFFNITTIKKVDANEERLAFLDAVLKKLNAKDININISA